MERMFHHENHLPLYSSYFPVIFLNRMHMPVFTHSWRGADHQSHLSIAVSQPADRGIVLYSVQTGLWSEGSLMLGEHWCRSRFCLCATPRPVFLVKLRTRYGKTSFSW